MVTRTFLDKTTTIKRGTLDNFGLHPISFIGYGSGVYRSLIHFDIENIRKLIEDRTYTDVAKVTHHLVMKNCGSVDTHGFFAKDAAPEMPGVKERATSFDVILFRVNKHWDEGIGFDNINDFWDTGKGVVSTDGATWYNATTDTQWDDEGIYPLDFIEYEYEKFLWLKEHPDYSGSTTGSTSGDTSGDTETIIVGTQHFDHGNENLDIDITDYVNSLIYGEENYGLCLAFIPELEAMNRKMTEYTGFFNNKTNTVFEPVIETRYNCKISDDRMTFYLGKDNKIYLYSYIGGKLENLDFLPECIVDDYSLHVEQESKGVYAAHINLSSKNYKKDMIIYDTWRNLSYQGEELDDVELEFVTKPKENFFSVSSEVAKPRILNPLISGINADEKLNRGEQRMIKLYFREPYTGKDYRLVDNCQYRIYVKDGEREVTIVDWDNINKMNTCNLFTIKTDEFVPADYHVDIRATFGGNVKIYKDELNFTIVSDVKEIKL